MNSSALVHESIVAITSVELHILSEVVLRISTFENLVKEPVIEVE